MNGLSGLSVSVPITGGASGPAYSGASSPFTGGDVNFQDGAFTFGNGNASGGESQPSALSSTEMLLLALAGLVVFFLVRR